MSTSDLFRDVHRALGREGKLTYQHQNISAKNAREFSKGLDSKDFELIETIDGMQDNLMKYLSKKAVKPGWIFAKVYHKTKGDELLQGQIEEYLEKRRAAVLEKMRGKHLYEMGSDGEPTWKK